MRVGRTFYSITDCDKAREKTQKNVQNAEENELETAARMDANPADQTLAADQAVRQMRCVSKDDPHIKGVGVPISPAWSRFISTN
jgi:hypothetical protein